MASVPITITGVLFDKHARTTQLVTLMGEASLTGLGVGGGPVIPPDDGKPPWRPPGAIWPDPGDPDYPKPPRPPTGIWPGPGDPDYPIRPVPPDRPNCPPPGSPPVIIGGTQPVHPMTPPPAVIIDYPGIGKVVVPLPTETAPSSA